MLHLHIEHLFEVKIKSLLFVLGLCEENSLLALRSGGQCPCTSRGSEGNGAGEENSGDGNKKLHLAYVVEQSREEIDDEG